MVLCLKLPGCRGTKDAKIQVPSVENRELSKPGTGLLLNFDLPNLSPLHLYSKNLGPVFPCIRCG